MTLATFNDVLTAAQEGHYAVPSLNTWDLLTNKTLIATAERLRSPLILSLWKTELDFVGEEELWASSIISAKNASIPVVAFVDHASTLDEIERSIRFGATSVMFDGSHHSLDENIRLTKEAAHMAHAAGISIEGELGVLGEEDGSDPIAALYTCVDDAQRFTEETGIDALAVAIGNAHGFYKQEPRLDFDRLMAIRECVDVPLVLHGGTGISDEDITKAIGMGITKINIGADGRHAFFQGLRASEPFQAGEKFPHVNYPSAVASHIQLIENKMRAFGSIGRA